MELSAASILPLLGDTGKVKIFRKPELGPNWFVRFRIKAAGSAGRGHLVFRSTQTADFKVAKVAAAKIFLDAHVEMARPPSSTHVEEAAVVPPLPADPTIENVVLLYDAFMATATPGSKRHPKPRTARANKNRLRQLARLLGIKTVEELRKKYQGLTPASLRGMQRSRNEVDLITDENFIPLVRGAACVFSAAAREFYAERGYACKSPFPSLPAVVKRPFLAPPRATVDALIAWAEAEIRPNPRDWMLFILCLGLGVRVQEAAHLRWSEVELGGVWVGRRKTSKGRFIRASPSLLRRIQENRPTDSKPSDWLVADGQGPGLRKNLEEIPEQRALRSGRRLAKMIREKLVDLGVGEQRNPIHYLRKLLASHVTETEQNPMLTAQVLGNTVEVAIERYIGTRRHAVADLL